MAINVHNFDASGAAIAASMDDDEGAPPTIPNMRVHKADGLSDIIPPPEDDPIEVGRQAAAKLAASKVKSDAAKAAKVPKVVIGAAVSDRRRCLELAVESGASGADQILDVASRFKAFLED